MEWLDQAREGDARAIAALLNQSLKPKGITVRAERQGYCLYLWLSGPTCPDQDVLVAYLRRRVEQWQVASIGILHIQAEPTDGTAPGWQVELSLLAENISSSTIPPDQPLEPNPEAEQQTNEELTPAGEKLSLDGAATLQTWLQKRGLPAQVALQEKQLHSRWPAVRVD
ncbi:MAG: hypothetical protein HC929_15725 [Leptolyngbyaceae cyanobacterium SM2_5_2]|nr:hypothetical protein [Leptolyngbyaceae cyanobacterium SM2_5_2]